MKNNYSKYLLLLSLLITFLIPKVYAEDQVYVEEINLVEHSQYAEEKNAPTKSGLNIGFDLSFSDVDDFAKYQIIVNNPTDTSYELSKNIDFNNSEYLEYKVEFEDDNNIVYAHQKKNVFITITYKNIVPVEMLTEGKFIENNSLSLNLSIEVGDTVINPSTMDRLLLYIFTLIITCGFSIAFYVITRNKKYLSIFVLGLLLIPFEAYAFEKLEFKVDTKVVIEKKYKVNYVYPDMVKTSEVDNYNIDDTEPCEVIQNTEYSLCSLIYTDPVLHAEGDEVSLLESVEVKVFKEDGELTSEILYFDGEPREFKGVTYNHSTQQFEPFSEEGDYTWNWSFDTKDSNDNNIDSYLNIFSEEGIVSYCYQYSCVGLKTPSTFKMQSKDMYFYAYFNIYASHQ